MNSYRIDMHVHTKNVSPCGKISAKELVLLYKKSGYDALVITDHYYDGYFERLGDLGWEAKINLFLTGYREALAVGNKIGLTIFLGMELRFTDSDNDYLVYGVTERFLKEFPALFKLHVEQFRQLIRDKELLIYQAHPFRPGMKVVNPEWLDGVEVYNGNMRHNSRNDLAYRFALQHRLGMISGSDFHQLEDLGRGGMVIAEKITSTPGLVEILRENRYTKLLGLDRAAV